MTNNKDLYAALLNRGAPELPSGFSYRFSIMPKYKNRFGEEGEQSRGLLCEIYKNYLGGLFSVKVKNTGRVISRSKMPRGYIDTEKLLQRGWITEKDVEDQIFTLGHLALLAEESHECLMKILAGDITAKPISEYLNKRIP